MFKRLFTLVMVALIATTSVSTVSAIKVANDFQDDIDNIYHLWGDFETPEEISHITTSMESLPERGHYKTTELSHVSDGADGSKKSIQVSMASADSDDYINFHFPAIAEERYDISFWLKTDAPGAKSILMKVCLFYYGHFDDIEIPLVAADGKWHKYEITLDGPDSGNRGGDGKTGGGAANLRFALTGCSDAYTFCIDRISAKPYGYVEAWDRYDAVNKHYYYATGTMPEEPEYGNVDTNPFSDISSHWGREIIRSLAGTGIINGMGDCTFAPDENVTRAEFIKMAVSVFADKKVTYDGRYTDVAKESWYAPFIAKADSYGVLAEELKIGSNLRPETPITREEAATIIEKVAKHRGAKKGKTATFGDEAKISTWAKESVKAATSYGIINGYADGTFAPDKNITRAEAAKMISKVVEITDRLGIYVDSKTGNDKNNGTQEAPLKSVAAARDMARKYSDKMQSDLFIFIRGEHYFDETFELDDRHSGKNGYDIVYTSWGEEKPLFTMAKRYTGFELHDEENNIWKIDIGKGTYSRHAYFNEVRGVRSRMVGYLKNAKFVDNQYFLCDNQELLNMKYPQEVEAVFHTLWTNNRYMVESFVEEEGRVRMNLSPYFHRQNFRIRQRTGRDERIHTPSYLENGYEFLDETGEWYIDKHEGYLYYIPRSGEIMETMELKLPIGNNLISAKGSGYSKKLANVTFDNIQFEGTTWSRVEENGGYAGLQNHLMSGTNEEGNEGLCGQSIGSALRFEKCENITFTNNKFRHMGLTCLEFLYGAKYITVEGNEFYDTSAHAMLVDATGIRGFEDEKPKEEWCEYLNINNNYIHHCAMNENGCASVGFGFTRHLRFTHNIILYSVYSGISNGWGWNEYNYKSSINYDNEISYNVFQDIMFGRVNDGAALYNLGGGSRELDSMPDAPNNGINKNRLINNYFSNLWCCDAFYTDSGSSNFYVANNVTDIGKHVKYENYNFAEDKRAYERLFWHHSHSNTMFYQTFENNYATHDYAWIIGHINAQYSSMEPTNIYPDRNWPAEALKVMDEAGIEAKYKNNFDLSGDKVFLSNDCWQALKVGNSADPGLLVYGIGSELGNLEDYDVRWSFSDNEALSLENGKIVAHKPGVYDAEARAVVNGIDMIQHYMFVCYDEIDVGFRYDTLNLLEGQPPQKIGIHMDAEGVSSFMSDISYQVGDELKAKVWLEDPTVANIEYDEHEQMYILTGVKGGKTKLVGEFEYGGETFTSTMDITYVQYSSKEAESLPFNKIELSKGWSEGATSSDGGTKVTALPAYWMDRELNNELIAFDMSVSPGNNWPALVFSNSGTEGDYNTVDCYMIGFRKDMLEVQRWRNGERFYIYGVASSNPAVGPGVPIKVDGFTKFEYNKRYSIVAGTLDTAEGTRIVVNINGVNILDYLDNSKNRLPAKGYFGMYNPAPGGTTFYPYSALTY